MTEATNPEAPPKSGQSGPTVQWQAMVGVSKLQSLVTELRRRADTNERLSGQVRWGFLGAAQGYRGAADELQALIFEVAPPAEPEPVDSSIGPLTSPPVQYANWSEGAQHRWCDLTVAGDVYYCARHGEAFTVEVAR